MRIDLRGFSVVLPPHSLALQQILQRQLLGVAPRTSSFFVFEEAALGRQLSGNVFHATMSNKLSPSYRTFLAAVLC